MNTSKVELVERLIEMMSRSSFQLRREEPLDWPKVELTMPQLRTLVFLQHAPRRMSDIAAFLGSGLSSATSMIERLESKQLVLRIHDPSDRRVVQCHLSEEGKAELERFWRVQTSKINVVADILSDEELTKVVDAMEILVAALERHDSSDDRESVASSEFTQGVDRS
jgi:DNA-binding MarR family transcriptional regulator